MPISAQPPTLRCVKTDSRRRRFFPSAPGTRPSALAAGVDWHLLAEIDLGDSSPLLARHYAWGLDKEGVRPGAGGVGGLLMVADHAYPQKTYLAMNDYIGNVVGLLDPDNGTVVAEYEYDPFGRTIRATGTYAEKNSIRFSSQYTDNETGLVYFGFRYYHPEWGRFINRDPIEEAGGENLYRFVSNDPVNRWDLLGLQAVTPMSKSRNQKKMDTEWSDGKGGLKEEEEDDNEAEMDDTEDNDDEPQAGQAQGEKVTRDQRKAIATVEGKVRTWVDTLVRDAVKKAIKEGLPVPSPVPIDGIVAGKTVEKAFEPVPYTTPYVYGIVAEFPIPGIARPQQLTVGTVWGRAEGSITFTGTPHYAYSEGESGMFYPTLDKIDVSYKASLMVETGGTFLGREWLYTKQIDPSRTFEFTPPESDE